MVSLLALMAALALSPTSPVGVQAPPLVSGAPPAATVALTAELAQCPLKRLTAEVDVHFDAALARKQPKQNGDLVFDAIHSAVLACIEQEHLDPELARPLGAYTFGLYSKGRAGNLLRSRGIPTEAIDIAANIGEGRANKLRRNLSPEDNRAISAELKRRGINPDRISQATWDLIDTYFLGTIVYHASKAELGV